MKTATPKPCPFCEEANVHAEAHTQSKGLFVGRVWCRCGASLSQSWSTNEADALRGAIEAWNRRPDRLQTCMTCEESTYCVVPMCRKCNGLAHCKICKMPVFGKPIVCEEHIGGALKGGLGVDEPKPGFASPKAEGAVSNWKSEPLRPMPRRSIWDAKKAAEAFKLRTLVFALESFIENARDDEQLEKMVIAHLQETNSPVWQRMNGADKDYLTERELANERTRAENAEARAGRATALAEERLNDIHELQQLVAVDADNVDHPKHYTFGKIEVIDTIEDWQLGFHEGNVVKYVARAKHKGNELEDLKKAAWYLNRRIEELSK